MHEEIVNVTSAHGVIPCFYTVPDLTNRWPAVIFYMDAPGIREELHNMARRIAVQGYACIVPDLYHRYGTLRFNVSRRNDAMTSVILSAYHALTDDDINWDTAGVIGYLDGRTEADSSRIGTVGYCMSGRFVTTTARHFSQRIVCAASLYGTRLVTDEPDSPHLHLDGITAELYYGFGSLDSYTPPDYISSLETSLQAVNINSHIDVFQDADHGYCFVERAAYHPAASEASWKKVLDLFKRNLQQG
ncbi:MAG: dienelactone hydrolase family protein [Pseudomonadota bacterium]